MRHIRDLVALLRATLRSPRAPARAELASPRRDAVLHVVEPGDDLWDIAARHLAAQVGLPVRALDDGHVADYWRRVIQANRSTLRTGDPDLLLPGEVIVLPPLP
jgi:nucleoid-associated protein YgaU